MVISLCIQIACINSYAQIVDNAKYLPKDYLSAKFHKERRQALRDLMPSNSVTVIFSYPDRVFSEDTKYKYHANPSLYYFSGYKEPDAVLFIFKDLQGTGESSYNELFFVQQRDPAKEIWTGRRLGVEGVKSDLGFKRVYNGSEFENFPIDFKKFNAIFYDVLPDDLQETGDEGNLKDLISSFKSKALITNIDKGLLSDLLYIYNYGTPKNISRLMNYLKPHYNQHDSVNEMIKNLMNQPDSATLAKVKSQFFMEYSGIVNFNKYINELRGVKTPEELVLIKKSVDISDMAHAEAMRAINPKISETELEGIFLYIHKKYGAEDEGYAPIVGAGSNGCILHYEENNVTEVNNQLVLMDVGAEYHGYSADITRTIPANGKYTEEQKAIYQLVYEAQEEIFKLCIAGVPFPNLNEKAKEILAAGLIKLGIISDAKEVGKYYPHGCSHHLGLDVHDKGGSGILKENMVITVEPGIYIPEGSPCDKKWWNIGVRIEDDVVIGKEKCILLSSGSPRKWQEIEKLIEEKSLFDQHVSPVGK